jgi:DNA polymerase-3 subunit alpha
MKGFVEVIVFPEVFKAALPCLRGGDPILVRGTLDLSEEHVKIKGIEIQSLPEGSVPTHQALHLKIPISSLTKPQLEELKEMMASSKGSYKVLLHLMDGKDGETIIAVSDQYTVDPSPSFQNQIKNLLKSPLISIE